MHTGLYHEPLTLPESTYFYTTIPRAFVWSRVCTALLGTATVGTLATWGGRLVGQRESLTGAALLALSAWAVIHDHYITVDGPSALTAALALMAALQVLRRPTWTAYLLAGVLVGLAAGTKYQNVLVAAPVALAHGLHWRRDALVRSPRLIAAGLVSIAVFLLTTPYLVLAFDDFRHDILTLLESYSDAALAHGDVTGAWPVGAYLAFSWREGLGPVPWVLALVGTVVLLRRDPASGAVLLTFPLLLVLALLRPETHFYRNLLPAIPPLMLLAGIGGIAILDRLQETLAQLPRLQKVAAPARSSRRRAIGVLFVLALLIPSFGPAFQASARLSQPDSRVLAQEYLRQEWPGVRVAVELSHPLRWGNVAQSTDVHYLPLHPVAWYRQQGYGLLLANSGRRGGRDAWTADYAPLLEAGREVASFGGRTSGLLGPRMSIIDIGLTTETIPSHSPHVRLGPLQVLGTTVGRVENPDGTGPEMRMVRDLQPGETLAVNVFWMAERPVPPAPYTVFLHLRNQEGTTVLQRDAPPWQGLFPPETWVPGTLVVEHLAMELPATITPGDYRLVMGLYHGATWARFPAFAGTAHLADDEVDLGPVRILPGVAVSSPPVRSAPAP
ncbi:MAG: phospholipid carrier-dependent glycosyltransferase [Chloroflexaceae bacterium]|nr:phospholipid carrier-dependent glycosyltransferase [Chloroflexaceae bacterium]